MLKKCIFNCILKVFVCVCACVRVSWWRSLESWWVLVLFGSVFRLGSKYLYPLCQLGGS